MTPKDWTLLALATDGKPMSPVQLQKSLFLISRNVSTEMLGRFLRVSGVRLRSFLSAGVCRCRGLGA